MSKKNKNSNLINKKDNTKLVNAFILFGIVLLIGSLVFMFIDNNKNNHIKGISYNEYKDLLEKDQYSVILLTSPTCTHCANYKPYVNLVADENDLEIYDINVTNLSEKEYYEIHDKYKAIQNEYDDNKKPLIPTPVTLIVRNGEEVNSVLGRISYDDLVRLLKNNGVIK